MTVLHVTYATTQGPITVVYDTADTDAWTVPQGAIRIMQMTTGLETFAPAPPCPRSVLTKTDRYQREGIEAWLGQ